MLEGFRATEQVASLRCSTDTAASSEFRVSWFSRGPEPEIPNPETLNPSPRLISKKRGWRTRESTEIELPGWLNIGRGISEVYYRDSGFQQGFLRVPS